MARSIVGGLLGLMFGVGLIVGGMTQPSKIIGFLDVFGAWDPSLLFVLGGAVLVYLPLFRWATRRGRPVLGPSFDLPTKRSLDVPLVVGSGIFGVGWGLAGYCPGPGLVSLGALGDKAIVFTAMMFVGFFVHQRLSMRKA